MRNLRSNGSTAWCLVVLLVFLSGCATHAGRSLSYDTISNDFKEGRARLTCGISCAFMSGFNSDKIQKLYVNKLWEDLATEVIWVGFVDDQAYFYLATAAENLGYLPAARRYYKLGAAAATTCHDLSSCEVIDVAGEIRTGLARVEKQIEDIEFALDKEVGSKIVGEVLRKAYGNINLSERVNVQQALKIAGYYLGSVDGVYSAATELALINYKSDLAPNTNLSDLQSALNFLEKLADEGKWMPPQQDDTNPSNIMGPILPMQ